MSDASALLFPLTSLTNRLWANSILQALPGAGPGCTHSSGTAQSRVEGTTAVQLQYFFKYMNMLRQTTEAVQFQNCKYMDRMQHTIVHCTAEYISTSYSSCHFLLQSQSQTQTHTQCKIFTKGNFSSKITFNYTYSTVAHKCNMRQLFAIPASYKNNIALAKLLRACLNGSSFFFGSHFLPWPCTFGQLSFSLFLLFDQILLSAHFLMLTFSSKGKAYLKRLGGKARGMKISSLPGESPPHSPPTLCLGSHLHPASPRSITFFCSSPFCVSTHLLPSVCAWRS